MKGTRTASRRAFLKGGALLAAPVAVAAAGPIATVGCQDDCTRVRLKQLEDEAAIRELHHSWVRQVNAGDRHALSDATVRRISVDHAGAPERIDIAANGESAVGYFDHAVETETPLAKNCTLAQMAHAQGSGVLRRSERRLLTVDYTKCGSAWKIGKVTLRPL